MSKKSLHYLHIAACLLAAAAGVYIGVRWLLPWLLPFVLGLAAAAAIEPAVSWLCRRGMKRALASGICVLLSLALVAALLWLLLHRGVGELRELVARLPELLQSVSATLETWKTALLGMIGRAPPGLADWLDKGVEGLRSSLTALPASLSARLLDFLTNAAAGAPETLLFLVTLIIGFYFISASYPSLLHGAAKLLPDRFLARARIVRRDLRRTLGRWLRAQLIMTAITFAFLAAAFALLRIDYALLLALLVALIDALPVLGTGIVLIPWALYDLLTGATAQAIGLAVTYAAVTVLHSSIQAKLLGDQLGLHPLATLVAIYVGFQTCGVWGMLLFPILAITGKQLYDSGVLRPGHII